MAKRRDRAETPRAEVLNRDTGELTPVLTWVRRKWNVSRAVKTLVREKVIDSFEPDGKYRRVYKLNDKYAWKGNLKNLSERRK